ncbi:MAG: malto-oligosyltrehalose synthase [Actinomycetales bacterium]
MAAHTHRPRSGRPVPVSTYRLQVRREQDFDEIASRVDYLASLGVSHLYLSPILAATAGSAHGYDVLDHSHVSPDAGGREAFDRLVARAHQAGLGVVVDVVPNHMTVPTPVRLNAPLWSVLKYGPSSPFAEWFDVSWPAPGSGGLPEPGGARALLMPVLGNRIGSVLAGGELTLDVTGDEPVLRYYDHEFPVREGTENLPLAELVDRQWYRLAHWKVGDEELNYRRFFDVGTLVAVRVESDAVFQATHALLLELFDTGQVDGFRIDHPDGLADPRGYLRRLAEATDGAWVVAEKILEGDEQLPSDWPCAGTTGYDALLRAGGLFVDPGGAAPLLGTWQRFAGRDGDPVPSDMASVVAVAKREVVAGSLFTEVARLVELLVRICALDVRLRDHTRRAFEQVITTLLVSFDRYRAYIVPGEPAPPDQVEVLDHAVSLARTHLGEDLHETLDLVRDLLLGREAGSAGRIDEGLRAELIVRFQQTCGPVMAKGIEDTAFYRWWRLAGLNEVGGDPDVVGVPPEDFHAFSSRQLVSWPVTMTTMTTHDTKRSEDARARLAVLSELPQAWDATASALSEAISGVRSPLVDGATEYLLWQTLFATRDAARGELISSERLQEYLVKAMREAKQRTFWTAVDSDYEDAVLSLARESVSLPEVATVLAEFERTAEQAVRANVLGQKLVQLTMPGVPDVYQGTELVETSLVDPDNRRPVDFPARTALLSRLDAGARPSGLDEEKLLVTTRALRLRAEHPDWFVGPEATYAPLPTTTGHLVAFGRGDAAGVGAVTLATRLAVSVADLGGWGANTVALPPGQWRDTMTGRIFDQDSPAAVVEVLADLPVALLVRA